MGRVLVVARVVLPAVLVVSLLLAAVVVVPGARALTKAPLVLGEAFGYDVPRPSAPQVERSESEIGGVVVDRYVPGSTSPPLLLVPGAARAGRDDDRVIGLAGALARAGREVVVPELALYDQDLDTQDVERVVRVAEQLCSRGGELVVFGFSFGGSLALVASADPRVSGCIDVVATFGAYVDLVGVIQAAATGVSTVDGEEHPWRGVDASTVRDVLDAAAVELVPRPDRAALREALESGDTAGLSPAALAVHRLVTADDPERVPSLVRELPAEQRALLEELSPATVADRVAPRVVAAHARDDPTVPYAELLRLEQVFPDAETTTVQSFQHVDLEEDGDIGTVMQDLVSASVFMASVLRPQEQWFWE